MVKIVNNAESLRLDVAERKRAGQRVALVPTMGALHEGHLSLIRHAREIADWVMVSIFVNPAQFGPNEDFDTYPRQLEADIALLEKEAVNVVYAPESAAMYPEGFATTVTLSEELTKVLCGAFRPQFFDGVATVVAKLLNQAMPDVAVFGEKDYQQLHIIRRMVKDLDISVEIIGAPTIREADGLALSSRNAYLSEQERQIAPALHRILQETAKNIQQQPDSVVQQLERAEQATLEAGFNKVDYLALVDKASLQPVLHWQGPARLLVAAWLGKTRLIDNIPVEPAL